MKKLKTAIIGLGKQNTEDHIPAVRESHHLELDSVVDTNPATLEAVSKEHNVDAFQTIEELLSSKKPDLAILALPHNQYLEIIEKLAEEGIHILKEKPFATNIAEAIEIDKIIQRGRIQLMITLQRRFNPIFRTFTQLRERIGKIYSMEGRYTMNIPRLDLGWRASKEIAGGGALIDMGYHYIDLLMWYFGLPQTITARMTTGNREGQNYDVEDTVNMLFNYEADASGLYDEMIGNFIISRVYPQKEEKLTVLGRRGIIEVRRGSIRRLTEHGEEVENLSRVGKWPSAAIEQVDFFATMIKEGSLHAKFNYRNHFNHVAAIEAAYRSHDERNSISPASILKDNKITI